MNKLQSGLLLGALASSGAMGADYSVGIVNAGSGFGGAGTALNLYSISHRGVELVKSSPFVFRAGGAATGHVLEPVAVAMSPAHDLVYVAYLNVPNLPLIVQFRTTPKGLEYQWEQEFSTGDAGLQGASISASSQYLIEKTYPDVGLYVYVINQAGETLVADAGSNGSNLVSGHVDPHGGFYYSCRYQSRTYTGVLGPADAVAVYALDRRVTESTPPLLTSTDPVFVRSECR